MRRSVGREREQRSLCSIGAYESARDGGRGGRGPTSAASRGNWGSLAAPRLRGDFRAQIAHCFHCLRWTYKRYRNTLDGRGNDSRPLSVSDTLIPLRKQTDQKIHRQLSIRHSVLYPRLNEIKVFHQQFPIEPATLLHVILFQLSPSGKKELLPLTTHLLWESEKTKFNAARQRMRFHCTTPSSRQFPRGRIHCQFAATARVYLALSRSGSV
jgi:hypothetical protein